MVANSAMPWWALVGLAFAVELVFVAALVMSFLGDDKTLLNVMCTAAITQALLPFSFFFGSSKSSQDKDASMAVSAARKDETIAASTAAKDATIASSAAALAVSVPLPPPPPSESATAAPTASGAPTPPTCPSRSA